MEFAMVTAAERNSEFIADLAAKCFLLCTNKAQMMCIPGRRPQIRLLDRASKSRNELKGNAGAFPLAAPVPRLSVSV
jgi:hypothetical protein